MPGARGRYEPFFYLWLDGEEVSGEILSHVKQFSYDDTDEKLDELKFTVIDKDMVLQGQGYFTKGAKVTAKWGYRDGMSETRECQIEELDYSFPENGLPEITVKALDRGIDLVTTKSRQCYQGMTGKEMITQVANKHNLKPVISIPDDFGTDHIAQGGKTDYDFVREIAAERCCIAWVENQELHVAENKVGTSNWEVRYRSGDNLLFSVRVRNKVRGKGDRSGTEVSGLEATKKQVVAEPGTADQTRTKFDDAGQIIATPAEPKVAEKKAKGHTNVARMQEMEADLRFVGIPTLKSKITIKITGIGDAFSGDWYLKSVRHEISGSGYTCSAQAVTSD